MVKMLLRLVCVIAMLIFIPAALAQDLPIATMRNGCLYIEATASGPAVTKIIVELQVNVRHISMGEATLTINERIVPVGAAYLCDDQGQPAEGYAQHLAFEISAEDNLFSTSGVSTINTDLMTLNEHLHGEWAKSMDVVIWVEEAVADGKAYSLYYSETRITRYVCPDAMLFESRSAFSGYYVNPRTSIWEYQTLQGAAYEPESLAGGEKNPLIIYLHGQTEGGTDINIALLGTEVTALAKEPIQSCFTAGDQTGAYVLVFQCPTYWMDEGDGRNSPGGGTSRYTEILMDAINAYLEYNPDADPSRIYIGGASNGGYMTVNMLINYPDVFAAGFPLCELYSYYLFERDRNNDYITSTQTLLQLHTRENMARRREDDVIVKHIHASGFDGALFTLEGVWLTEEKIEALKQTPIWFVSSIDDGTSQPVLYLLPTYRALLQSGAENCHLSLFATKGHSVWKQFFQGEVTGVQDPDLLREGMIPLASNARSSAYNIAPTDEGGGTLTAEGFSSIFEWLNAQSK